MKSRLVSTYSIAAIDRRAGQMGVAVQSHWFSVGSVVPWGEPGVGVVATQAFVEPSYGPKGLSLMRRGAGPGAALRQLLRADSRADVRQVAMLDVKGRVAAHTGSKCLPHAGDLQGRGFSVQANLMSNDRVWPAMGLAFSRSRGPLTERFLAALEAAEEAGGDIRGRQSAAILIVSTSRPREKWRGRLVDLRVEDNPAPLKELRRLVRLSQAYDHANKGDDLVAEKRFSDAMKEYSLAAKSAPEIVELRFWQGVTLLDKGRSKQALPLLIGAFRARRQWREVFASLPSYGLLHAEERVVKSILARR
ncbi:MAG: DUF1028 domain-containing protein [Thaumarchaeota archaeon]|nr:DUF1028 domain-containing protein [Nitrososphaerota archaeon]